MKKFSTGLLTGLIIGLLLAGSAVALASTPIKLLINGQYIQCDVQPQMINNRVMVPAAYVAEALGATVSWDDANQTVVINGEGYVAPSTVNSNEQAFKTTAMKVADLVLTTDKLVLKSDTTIEEIAPVLTEIANTKKEAQGLSSLSPEFITAGVDMIGCLMELDFALKTKAEIINGSTSKDWVLTMHINMFTDKLNDLNAEIKLLVNRGIISPM